MRDLPHVATVQQRGDNTVVVYVQTDSFKPGQQIEISVYLTQGDSYAAFTDKKRIPLPDPKNPEKPAELHVELPATKLDADQDVTVITRLAEVWPSVLQKDSKVMERYKELMGSDIDQGLKAVWTYQEPEGKVPGDSESPPPSSGGTSPEAP